MTFPPSCAATAATEISLSELRVSHPNHLARLFDLADSDAREWGPGDIASILRHQLLTPLRVDLPDAAGELSRAAPSPPIETFGDLLNHPSPPLPLLKRVKEFAKASRMSGTTGPLHPEVATIIYYAAVAAALLRHHARITRLDHATLRQGFEWAVRQMCLDDSTRALLQDAMVSSARTGPCG